jgi:hypothetical protein
MDERERRDSAALPPGLVVTVLGPATVALARALWEAGLRPVRGQRYGSVWAVPEQARTR